MRPEFLTLGVKISLRMTCPCGQKLRVAEGHIKINEMAEAQHDCKENRTKVFGLVGVIVKADLFVESSRVFRVVELSIRFSLGHSAKMSFHRQLRGETFVDLVFFVKS